MQIREPLSAPPLRKKCNFLHFHGPKSRIDRCHLVRILSAFEFPSPELPGVSGPRNSSELRFCDDIDGEAVPCNAATGHFAPKRNSGKPGHQPIGCKRDDAWCPAKIKSSVRRALAD